MFDSSLIINREYPRTLPTPWKIALGYLVALAVAEVLTTLGAPLAGMIIHGLILLTLLVQASLSIKKRENRFLVVLALVPLMRLLSLTLPLNQFPITYWYAVIGVPLFIAVYIGARVTGLKCNMIGLRLSWRTIPGQLLIGISGILLGYIEYLILRPDPIVAELRWELVWLPALILLIFTGLLEEIIFRGMLQTSATQELGRLGILYVAVLFAALHLGYRSLIDVLFVFAVAVLFGILTQRTGTLAGVSLSHGLTNISLYLIFPFLLASPVVKSNNPATILSPDDKAPFSAVQVTPTAFPSATPTPAPVQTESDVQSYLPITGAADENLLLQSEPTASQSDPLPSSCIPPLNWVRYTVQQEDTISRLSVRWGVSIRALQDANCLENVNLITVGQQLFIPFSILPGPTTVPSPTSEPLPTQTPTKLPPHKATNSPIPSATPLLTNTPAATGTPHPAPTLAPITGTPGVETPTVPTLTPTPGE